MKINTETTERAIYFWLSWHEKEIKKLWWQKQDQTEIQSNDSKRGLKNQIFAKYLWK